MDPGLYSGRVYGRSGKQKYALELTDLLSSGKSSIVLLKLIPRHVLFQEKSSLLQSLYLHDQDEVCFRLRIWKSRKSSSEQKILEYRNSKF
ncbi:hypothetical protein CEXT_239911 [Caerostris extrusa]|uniref:Uncharacterized protein n=1 Tax=Caerostris extrusa TaxID=172846 RepID=A0AAV4XHX2_CAEEX|nr:hypothetical protein CEXT_239911 [Caerostris extrusa]